MGKIQLSISDVFRSEPCRPQWDYPVFIAVPDQLGHVIPSGFFSEIRPEPIKPIGYQRVPQRFTDFGDGHLVAC
ncbi:hypothetical protein [Klebsiella pneumoniae]|uniref:hypothetical protein n=1 Tax=Klebsiella pneumoniae TaxID=573 RepID=UPI003EE2870E